MVERRVIATEANFNEQEYLLHNPDVAAAVKRGEWPTGHDHFQQFGKFERRPLCVEQANGLRYTHELLPHVEAQRAKRSEFPEITDSLFWGLYDNSAPYSILLVTGFYNIYQSVRYVIRNNIPGDFVECGCLLGGASIFAHLTAHAVGDRRKMYLFDTFEGIPGEECELLNGGIGRGCQHPNYLWAVKENLAESGCDQNDFVFVPGKVEDTLPQSTLDNIAFLRLDTDFYSSSRCELEQLYPRLNKGGIIIIDDYGLWSGSRKATDEYFARSDNPPLLNRIDAGVWAGVKPHG